MARISTGSSFPLRSQASVASRRHHRLVFRPRISSMRTNESAALVPGDRTIDLPETLRGNWLWRKHSQTGGYGTDMARREIRDLDSFYPFKTSIIQDCLLTRRVISASTGKPIHYPTLATAKMTPSASVKPCPGISHEKAGIDKEPYNLRRQLF